MYNPNEAIKLLNRALEAKHPRDCLSCIHSALAILESEPEPTELTKEHWRWLASFNSPEPWWANRFSECLKEIDRLTAENKVNANRIEEFEKLLKIFINSPQSMRVPNWVVIKCEQALL